MKKMKKIWGLFPAIIVLGFIVVSCNSSGDELSGAVSGKNTIQPVTAASVAIGDGDKTLAAEIPAVSNQSRSNASGPSIPSGEYSDVFPGICFFWDAKTADDGYLKVAGAVFDVYESFILTTKEADKYWDFIIMPQDNQRLTEDGSYIFFLPRASEKSINKVFLSEWAEKEEPPNVDLLEKYGLSIDCGIYNDHMPGVGNQPHSYCFIIFDSTTELPPIEVSATIITEKITIPVLFYDNGYAGGVYGAGFFRKYFYPVDRNFRLDTGEEYTIKITVKISGEQQTITSEKQRVSAVW